ncbi:MAG: phosphodiester glycosidase family protein [Myxococcales bacterium]|nr:phosphodiester glycosidase family protein [Myxococcales bacterium]
MRSPRNSSPHGRSPFFAVGTRSARLAREQSRWRAGVRLLALSGVLAACGRAPAPEPLRWQSLQPGLEYARAETHTGAGGDLAIHLVRIVLNRWELVLVDSTATKQPLADARTFREAVGGVLAVNAGYFDPQFQPLGLRVSRGRQLGPLRRVDQGVFTVGAGRAGLQHAKEWVAPAALEFALQCGPRLLVAGSTPAFRDTARARRTALGTDAHGQVVIAATDGALSLAEFAAALAHTARNGGPGLVDALNLDGGSSTMLDLHAGTRAVALKAALGVPVGVAVVARD